MKCCQMSIVRLRVFHLSGTLFIALQFVFSPLEGSVVLLNLGLQSLLIIQVLCSPSCEFGNTLQESSAGSWTKTQTKTSVRVINNTTL